MTVIIPPSSSICPQSISRANTSRNQRTYRGMPGRQHRPEKTLRTKLYGKDRAEHDNQELPEQPEKAPPTPSRDSANVYTGHSMLTRNVYAGPLSLLPPSIMSIWQLRSGGVAGLIKRVVSNQGPAPRRDAGVVLAPPMHAHSLRGG